MARSPLLPQQVEGHWIIGLDTTKFAAARSECGFTQGELARRAGLSEVFVAKLEQGSKKPSIDTVRALAEALGVGLTAICVSVPVPDVGVSA